MFYFNAHIFISVFPRSAELGNDTSLEERARKDQGTQELQPAR
jgi:hypothetical protein